MKLSLKIKIASVLCVVLIASSVAAVFIYSLLASILFVLGVAAGTKAAKWKKQLAPGESARTRPLVTLPKRLLPVVMGIWWLFFFLLTIALFWLGSIRLYQCHLFEGSSVKISGTVLEKHKDPNGRNHYFLTYAYSDEKAERFQIRTAVDARTWFQLNQGDSVPVKYLPKNAAAGRLDIQFEDQDEGAGAFFTLCLGLVFLIFGVGLLSLLKETATRFATTATGNATE